MTTHALETRTPENAIAASTIGSVASRIAVARDFMRDVLVRQDGGRGGDYGTIPGCGPKPVLYKAGAEKYARLFDLSVGVFERTMLERMDEGFVAGYRYAMQGPDGRSWGEAEAFAAESEKTFERQSEAGPALLNSLTARAQKRAYVRAVIQAIGISSLFTDGPAGVDMIDERQRAIVVRIHELVVPSLVDRVTRQATKIRVSQWDVFLRGAVDTAGDFRKWDAEQRERVFRALDDDLATAATVDDLLGARDVEDAGEVVDGELVEASDAH